MEFFKFTTSHHTEFSFGRAHRINTRCAAGSDVPRWCHGWRVFFNLTDHLVSLGVCVTTRGIFGLVVKASDVFPAVAYYSGWVRSRAHLKMTNKLSHF